jgi:glycerol dehydrogenase
MAMVLIAPRKYVQGRGVMKEIGTHLGVFSKRPALLWDATVRGIVGKTVLDSLKAAGLTPVEAAFNGETTKAEAARVAKIAADHKGDAVVGLGGGKALDTAKAAAAQIGVPFATVPTLASNDSPTSSYTVWYDEKHNFLGFDCWGRNPDLVLVDSEVIARAPISTLVSGIGDGLSTYIEAAAVYKTHSPNLAGGTSTLAAMAIARLCFDTLLQYSAEALRAAEARIVTPALEKVIEAATLHSGLGFESVGVATAHMIGNLLSNVPECHHLMHGHQVGFGIVAQLCLDEDMTPAEMNAIVDFEVAVGLPVTFADLNLAGATREKLRPIAEACAGPGSLCAAHNFKVTCDGVLDAMLAADLVGQARKKAAGKS